MLRQDEKYLWRHSSIVTAPAAELDRLDAGLKTGAADPSGPNIEALRDAVAMYAERFGRLSELNLSLGLTADVGLEGKLRSAVHGIEKILNELGVPEMQVKMLMMRRHEKDFIMRVDQKYVDRLSARVAEFREFPDTLYPSAEVQASVLALLAEYQREFQSYSEATLEERETRRMVSASFAEAEPLFGALKEEVAAYQAAGLLRTAQTGRYVLIGSAVLIVASFGVFFLRIVALARGISIPLKRTAEAIEELSEGHIEVEPPQSTYREIATIADAFKVFRKTIVDSRALEAETREKERRDQARREQDMLDARDAEKAELAERQKRVDEARARDARITEEIAEVVAACARGDFNRRLETSDKECVFVELCEGINQISEVTNTGLQEVKYELLALAEGDLTHRMNREFSGVFEDIPTTVNATAESLANVVMQIDDSSTTIGASTGEIAAAASDLAVRTERNAAALEETVAAIEQLSASVASTADVAGAANEAIDGIKTLTARSNEVVENTVESIQKIQLSSAKISKIVGLIDDIAFQANLLALNAGVEAARAGDAGKGFSVVASEVRALAIRSADAAKEISEFIGESEEQVEQGVSLVYETGAVLKSISASISGIAKRIEDIAISAREQSTSISEINAAATQLDQSTQQNAAMYEEATASSQVLKAETDALAGLISAFQIGAEDRRGAKTLGLNPGPTRSSERYGPGDDRQHAV